ACQQKPAQAQDLSGPRHPRHRPTHRWRSRARRDLRPAAQPLPARAGPGSTAARTQGLFPPCAGSGVHWQGKAHRPYEFGVKVSAATPARRPKGVPHVAALPGTPYDGHTLATVIPAMENMIGNTVERLLADAGYRGRSWMETRSLMVSCEGLD